MNVTKRVKESKRREIKKEYVIESVSSKITKRKKTFFEKLLSFKDFIPLISVLSAILAILKIFIIRGIKEYYGIPNILEISSASFFQLIIETVCYYVVIVSCSYIYYESHEYFMANSHRKKTKLFISCFTFHLIAILLFLIFILLFVSFIAFTFNGLEKNTSVIKINSSNWGYALLILLVFILLIVLPLSIADTRKLTKDDGNSNGETSNNGNKGFFKGAKHIYNAGMCFMLLMSLMVFSLFSGLFVDFGKTIGEKVDSYAIVSCEDGQYAVLAKGVNEYICVKIADEEGKQYNLNDKIFKIIDLKEKELTITNCKYEDLFFKN